MVTLNVNGRMSQVDVPRDMPLLWVLRDVIGLTGTKFGCGMALCGACTVHLDGQPIRSCVTPVAAATGKRVTTIEGIGGTATGQRVQKAWLELEVARPTSIRPWPGMSVAAVPIRVSGPRSSRRRPGREPDGGRERRVPARVPAGERVAGDVRRCDPCT